MDNWKIKQTIDLSSSYSGPGIWPSALMVNGDRQAHTWEIEVRHAGQSADLTGVSVTAYFNRADNVTVPVKGSISGNIASVTLEQACYAVPGMLTGIFRLTTASGEILTASVLRFTVSAGPCGTIVDPGNVIPSLADLLAQIELMEQGTAAANAAASKANAAAEYVDANMDAKITARVDKTLSEENGIADAKATGEALSSLKGDLDSIINNFQNEINILSLDKITDGLYLDLYFGYLENENYCVTDFIKVDENTDYTAVTGDYFDSNGYLGYRFVYFYDKSKNIINSIESSYQSDVNFTTPDNCQYVIIVYHALSKGKPMLLLGNFASARFFKYIEYVTELVCDIDITRIKNIFKPRKNHIKDIIENTFLSPDYILIQYAPYKTTGYIPVKKDTSYVISPRYRMYALFSEGGNALAYNDIETTEPTVVIPDQDGYIRITSYMEDDMQLEEGETFTGFEPYKEEFSANILLNEEQKRDIGIYNNVLYGKKWVACGDSFTEGVDGEKFADGVFAGKNKVYPFFIGERNNMTIVNEAVSGSSMTYISERHNSWENGCFSANRYKNIPSDADYITLYFGINDDNYSAPIGTIDDTENTTFYGAWNIVLEHLIVNHPFAKIGIIITNGSSKKYTDAERAISRKWGIPYLDMEADYQHVPLMQRVTERTEVCQKALELRKKAFAVSDSNTHPNAKAHEYESTFIENWLRTL